MTGRAFDFGDRIRRAFDIATVEEARTLAFWLDWGGQPWEADVYRVAQELERIEDRYGLEAVMAEVDSLLRRALP